MEPIVLSYRAPSLLCRLENALAVTIIATIIIITTTFVTIYIAGSHCLGASVKALGRPLHGVAGTNAVKHTLGQRFALRLHYAR